MRVNPIDVPWTASQEEPPKPESIRLRCLFPPPATKDGPAVRPPHPVLRAAPAAPLRRVRQAPRGGSTPARRDGAVVLGEVGRSCAMAALTVSLVGCASFGGAGSTAGHGAPLSVAPVLRMTNYPAAADDWYQAGKSALKDGLPQWALLHFDQAEKARPGWADAINGKVVALARMGRLQQAVDLAQRTVAAGIGGDELLANLAMLTTRVAARALPAPAVVGAPAGVAEPAVAPAVAASVASSVRERTEALTPPAQVVTAAVDPVAPSIWIQPERNVLELRMVASTPPASPGAPAASPAVGARTAAAVRADAVPQHAPAEPSLADAAGVALEISNGAGRERMARDTAASLKEAGVPVRRLTNHVSYDVRRTEIHYRGAGHLAAAQALARSLAVPATLVDTDDLRADIDVKVLLGRDAADRLASAQALVLPAAPAVAVAVAAGASGR